MPGKAGKEKKIKKLLPLLAVPTIFLLDRVSKKIVIDHYQEGQGFSVWPGVFHITRVNNTGAAFGMMQDQVPALSAISLICVIGLAIVIAGNFLKTGSNLKYPLTKPRYWALILVVSGALGNLYDRFFYGYVLDFLDFRVWPVFNVADSFICIGMFLIVWSFFGKKEA